MVTDYYTAKEVAEILDIYVISAWELMSGVTPFEDDELVVLASAKGLRVEQLVR